MKILKTVAVIGLVICILGYLLSNAIWTNKLVDYCEKQDIKAVQEMLDSNVLHGVNGNVWRHFPSAMFTNKTALVAACETNNLELISMLIDAGADPNKRCVGEDGITVPLFSAINNAESPEIKDIIACLIKAGADPDYTDVYKDCALLLIAEQGNLIFDENDNVIGIDTEYDVALTESYKIVLDKAVNKRPVDDQGRTALHWAAYLNNESLVRYLVEEQGMDICVKDADGQTPRQFCEGDRSDEGPIVAEARKNMIRILKEYEMN